MDPGVASLTSLSQVRLSSLACLRRERLQDVEPVMYEAFEHTADIGLRIRAADRAQLYAEAGRALMSLLVANPGSVRADLERTLTVDGDQEDYLLFDWLCELLYRYDTEHLLLAEFELRFGEGGLQATCRGERVDPKRHQLDHEVKAITYHEFLVQHDEAGWLAEVIVDI